MKNISTNSLIVGIAIAALGFGLGYSIRTNQVPSMGAHTMNASSMMGSHMMGKGSMMEGSSMQGMMDGMMSNLKGKTGNEFDRAFLSEMIVHHQGAVEMAQAALKNSNRPELIKLANEIMTAQRKEIQMMQGWQTSWFNQ